MKKIIFVLPFLLVGCDDVPVPPVPPSNEVAWQYGSNSNQITKELVYTYDRKTNLCYAAWPTLSPFTSVPCTTEVIAEIKREYYAH